MSKVSEMVDAQELRYVLRDEAAHASVVDTKSGKRQSPKDMQIHTLEADIHPQCECCGERIQGGNSAGEACSCRCTRCDAAADRK